MKAPDGLLPRKNEEGWPQFLVYCYFFLGQEILQTQRTHSQTLTLF